MSLFQKHKQREKKEFHQIKKPLNTKTEQREPPRWESISNVYIEQGCIKDMQSMQGTVKIQWQQTINQLCVYVFVSMHVCMQIQACHDT